MLQQQAAQHGQQLLPQLLQVSRAMASSASSGPAPALASKAASSDTNIAAMFGFGSQRITTPLTEPLPWVPPAPKRAPSSGLAPRLETSTLASGLPVAAVATPGPLSSLAIAFEGGGSASEGPHTRGASAVLASMAFRSATANRTAFRLTRELEKVGTAATATSGRDHLTMTISAVRMHAPEAVEVLLDAALNARLSYHEFMEAVADVQGQLRSSARSPAAAITDALHRAAFDGPLGLPQQLDAADLGHLDFAVLREHYATVVKPSRAVLAAAGVGLQEVAQLANPLLPASAQAAAGPSAADSTYVGGVLNLVAPSALTHIALALEVKGGLSEPKRAAAAAVARVLLDATRAVLPRTTRESSVFVSSSSFTHMYGHTGLLGVSAASSPAQASQLVDAVNQRFEAVAKGVPEQQLQQAKQMAVSALKQALSSSRGMVGTIAPHLLLAGRFDPAQAVADLEAVSAKDVASMVAEGLKAPSMVSYGSLAGTPRSLGARATKHLA